ncbi:conjugal transfer protein TraF [Enterovibrio norvegicus]|uniref:conjugal transfer protein TraF n=1 Tax=Enterovibrio norvegicus TaxID=188144 RepID=UPI000CC1904C|nr:conjugal transfer protein TraF [Enterovibrio norvegicus]PMN72759.1 hypothetical protein BCT27_13180 [Enterovibrio norvegicus]
MKQIKKARLTLAIGLIITSLPAAAFGVSDSRSLAMGGTGVASSSYLMAPFHNPAQAVNYSGSDDFGFLLSIGAGVHDGDDLYNKIDHFQDVDEALENMPDNLALQDEWKQALRAIDNGQLNVDTSIGLAAAIPNKHLSMNVFVQANVATIALSDVAEDDLQGQPNPDNMVSTVQGMMGGTVDAGITLARAIELPFEGQRLSVGATPKAQHIVAVNYKNTVSGFEEDEFDLGSEYQKKTVFNADFGVSYLPTDSITLGFAAKNIFAQELETNQSYGSKATFLVEPKYTVGAAYSNGVVTIAADYDISKTRFFREVEHETQFARVGVELNAWDWAQLRAGYSASMTDYASDTITAGIGFKPFGAFGFDLGAYYGEEENQVGVSAQFVITL